MSTPLPKDQKLGLSMSPSRTRWGNGLINILLPAWLICLSVAYFLLPQSFCTIGNVPLGPDRATFAVINAATLTGFSQEVGIRQLAMPGQWIILGVSVISALVYLVLGTLAVGRITRSSRSDGSLVLWSVGVYAAMVGVGLLAGPGHPASSISGPFLAVSAAGNSALAVGNWPGMLDWRMAGVLMPLGLIAGLGICPLLDLLDRITGRTPKLHANTVATLWIISMVFLLGLVTLCLSMPSGETEPNFAQWFTQRGLITLSAMGPGYNITDLAELPRASQWILTVIMFIGAGSGGLGGGLKAGTIATLITGTRKCLGGQSPGRGFGIALTWLGCYVGGIVLLAIVLIGTQTHIPADRLVIESVASASNTGLSFGNVAIVRTGPIVMSLLMLLGRMGGLLVLWWVAESASDAEVALG